MILVQFGRSYIAIIICCVLSRSVGAMQRQCRLGDGELTLCVDRSSQRLLYYNCNGLENEDDMIFINSDNDSDTEMSSDRNSDIKIQNKDGSNAIKDKGVLLDRETCIDGRAAGVEIRHDLQDCDVMICSPETLYVFRENFDYQRIRQDFIQGILSDETLGNKLHVYELNTINNTINGTGSDNRIGEYASRVHNLRSYDSISRDIIMRWTYPFVPDIMNVSSVHPAYDSNDPMTFNNNNEMNNDKFIQHNKRGFLSNDDVKDDDWMSNLLSSKHNSGNYDVNFSDTLLPLHEPTLNGMTMSNHYVYTDRGVTVPNTSIIGSYSLVNTNSHIGENVTIMASIIGFDVQIGNNVVIEDSYIHDNVTIFDNCVIRGSMVFQNVTILKDVMINQGCVLSYDVVIGPDVELQVDPDHYQNSLLTLESGAAFTLLDLLNFNA